MSDRPIIDAGPALNFFSINREKLLKGRDALDLQEAADPGRRTATDRNHKSAVSQPVALTSASPCLVVGRAGSTWGSVPPMRRDAVLARS